MAKKNNNGIASAADFRKMEEAFSKPERVRLPKLGKDVMLRRPHPLFFFVRGKPPLSLSSKVSTSGTDAALTYKEIQEGAAWMFEIIKEVMVEPKCSMNPGPGEISADMIHMDDAKFIVDWAQGIIFSGGGDEATSLDRFRGEREPEVTG